MRHGEVHNPDRVLYGRIPGFHLSELGQRMARGRGRLRSTGHRPITAAHRVAAAAHPGVGRSRGRQLFGLTIETDERLIEPTNKFEGKTIRVRTAGAHQAGVLAVDAQPVPAQLGRAVRVDRRRGCSPPSRTPGAPPTSGDVVMVSHQLADLDGAARARGRQPVPRPAQPPLRLSSITTLRGAATTLRRGRLPGSGGGTCSPSPSTGERCERALIERRRRRRWPPLSLCPAARPTRSPQQYRERRQPELHRRRRHRAEIPPPNRDAPIEFTSTTDAGTTVSSADYRGRGPRRELLVRRCAPCRVEAPDLETLSPGYDGKGAELPRRQHRRHRRHRARVRRRYGVSYPSILDARLRQRAARLRRQDAAERGADHPRARHARAGSPPASSGQLQIARRSSTRSSTTVLAEKRPSSAVNPSARSSPAATCSSRSRSRSPPGWCRSPRRASCRSCPATSATSAAVDRSDGAAGGTGGRAAARASLLFVLGFTLVFVTLTASRSARRGPAR